MLRSLSLVLGVLAIWGFAKMPWEKSVAREVNQIKYGNFQSEPLVLIPSHDAKATTPLAVAVRDNIGQGLALAALGGFRGLAANFACLNAQTAWQDMDWYNLRQDFEVAAQLQPRSTFFWDMGAWHMAWNASLSWPKYGDPSNPTRNKIEAERWIEIGRQFLLRGIMANPESTDLLLRMGDLYAQRLEDYHSAYLWYAEAAKRPDSPLYASRLAGRWLMKAGEYEQAYEYFKNLLKNSPPEELSVAHHQALLEKSLRECEKKLGIPPEKSFLPH